MTSSSLEEKFKWVMRSIGVLFLISEVIVNVLSIIQVLKIPRFFVGALASSCLLCAILCFISSFIKDMRAAIIVIITIMFNVLGSFPQLNIIMLYLLPIMLSLYTYNRKFIWLITGLHSSLFVISVNIRNYFLVTAPPPEELLASGIGVSVMGLIEVSFLLCTAIPLFIHLIETNISLSKSLKEKETATEDILQFCSTATAYHDKYLRVHIAGVKQITKIILDGLIANGYKISDEYYNQILFSVQFHDIGKIYIDSSLLEKDGKLSAEEYEYVKKHPIKGFDLFKLLPKNVISEAQDLVCKNVIIQHHERCDGSGYPLGLTEKDISFEGKIVAVADVVDALLSWRTYKKPMTWDRMCEILLKEKDKYDKDVLNIVLRSKKEILEASDANNLKLKELMSINEEQIVRS